MEGCACALTQPLHLTELDNSDLLRCATLSAMPPVQKELVAPGDKKEPPSVVGGEAEMSRTWGTDSQPRRSCSDFIASWVQPSCHSHHSVLSRAAVCVTVGPVLTGKLISSQRPQPDVAQQFFQLFMVKPFRVYIFRFTFILFDQGEWYCAEIKGNTSSTM